jgi:hypothetical protein
MSPDAYCNFIFMQQETTSIQILDKHLYGTKRFETTYIIRGQPAHLEINKKSNPICRANKKVQLLRNSYRKRNNCFDQLIQQKKTCTFQTCAAGSVPP